MTVVTDFYLDYISPYAYLGWLQARQWEREGLWTLCPKPVLFAGLLKHWGQLGPAEIPSKREFTFRHVARLAAEQVVPLQGPASHPFNPLLALRMTLAAEEEERSRVVDCLFSAIWGQGIEASDGKTLEQVVTDEHWNGAELLAAAKQETIKQSLVRETEHAIERGVFGVPTVFVDGELFWGQDSLRLAKQALDGNDVFDSEASKHLLDRPQRHRKR